ncbi:MAG TPA: AAA family ATPase [Streptosporangiaceae bacterium]|jgi:adenosylcobyric acid synthase|nr:AAA family ATPase [Streptosporangiaceae bacterium]
MTNTHRGLVVLGTSSGVGKTLVTIAVCRWFRDHGVRVAPFKALSMQPGAALHATPPDGAIHYHQAYQAVAAGVRPHGDLNPIALWGTLGRVATSIRGRRMDDWLSQPPEVCTSRGRLEILEAYRQLVRTHEVIVAEGCGSPVEMNLKDRDVTNLWLADAVDASCILVCSTFHGGVFASLLGTVGLMTRAERRRVLGFVVNRFAGDLRDFDSAVEILERRSGLPCLGVIPHFAKVPLGDPVPVDPGQVRRQVASTELEARIAAWTAHVSEHVALDRLLEEMVSRGASGARYAT